MRKLVILCAILASNLFVNMIFAKTLPNSGPFQIMTSQIPDGSPWACVEYAMPPSLHQTLNMSITAGTGANRPIRDEAGNNKYMPKYLAVLVDFYHRDAFSLRYTQASMSSIKEVYNSDAVVDVISKTVNCFSVLSGNFMGLSWHKAVPADNDPDKGTGPYVIYRTDLGFTSINRPW